MDKYSHRERLEIIFKGEKPDRFAVSFWRHFFHKEHYAEGTVAAMLDFQKRFDWDFMKINPRADYHIEGWGFKQEWSYDEFKKHKKTHFPVKSLDDWKKIEPLKLITPSLDEHLKVVFLLRKKTDKNLPLLMTVFTPLAIAGRMVENKRLLVEHIHNHPETIHLALEAITQTFEKFAEELRNAGADGLFFATLQWASNDLLSWEEYQQFGVPYDLRVIKAAEENAINLLHICSSNNFLQEILTLDYPCKMYNWESDDPTNLPLDKGLDIIKNKPVVGGVDHQGWLLHSSPDEIKQKIEDIKNKYDAARLIIGPGCCIPPEVPFENLQAIRDKVNG